MTSPKPSSEGQLRRDFTLRSAFSLAFAFVSPIVALYGIFALSIVTAGPSFWLGFGVVLLGQLAVALVFAELVSRWPIEGSVFQWSRRLLGERFGWFAGWTYICTLVIGVSANSYASATFLAAIFDWEASPTALAALAAGVVVCVTLGNGVSKRVLRVIVALSIAAEVIGSVVIGTVLLLFFRVNSLSVLFEGSGDGLTFAYFTGPFVAAIAFLGWAFVGFESAAAIAEEVVEPRKNIPKAMVWSLILVAIVVMYSGLALILAIPDLSTVAQGDAVVDTLVLHLGEGIAEPMFALIIIGFMACSMAIQASGSRILWAYARDNVMPASRFLARLSGQENLPRNSILVTAVASGALMLLATSDFYSTLVSMSTAGFYLSFAFPVIAAIIVRVRGGWTAGPFTLRRWSTPVLTVATIWVIAEVINIAWPRLVDVPWFERWSVVVMATLCGLLGAGLYVARPKQSTAPPSEFLPAANAQHDTGAQQ